MDVWGKSFYLSYSAVTNLYVRASLLWAKVIRPEMELWLLLKIG